MEHCGCMCFRLVHGHGVYEACKERGDYKHDKCTSTRATTQPLFAQKGKGDHKGPSVGLPSGSSSSAFNRVPLCRAVRGVGDSAPGVAIEDPESNSSKSFGVNVNGAGLASPRRPELSKSAPDLGGLHPSSSSRGEFDPDSLLPLALFPDDGRILEEVFADAGRLRLGRLEICLVGLVGERVFAEEGRTVALRGERAVAEDGRL